MSSSDKADIIPIQSSDIGQFQEIALPFIKSALEYTDGETSIDSVLSDVATQKRQLWLIKAGNDFIGAVVTQIYSTQSGQKIGEITLAGGWNYPSWDHFSDVVGAWFKEMGCHCIQIIGRRGWKRRMAAKGFNERYIILRKGLI